MQKIDITELLREHARNWRLIHTCNFLDRESDINYEFLYDEVDKNAIINVIEKATTFNRIITSYRFDDPDITIAQTLAMCGVKSNNITIDWGTTPSGEPIDPASYVNSPVKTASLASGIIKTV